MKRILVLTAALFATTVFAESTWIGGATGAWNDPDSWSGGSPAGGSTVVVPGNCDMPVTDDDMAIVSQIAAIRLEEADSTVTFTINGDASVNGTITGKGGIVKEGSGVLHLKSEEIDGYSTGRGMTINAGTLECPQTFGSGYSPVSMDVGHVHIEAGATFVPYAKYRTTSVAGLSGAGTVDQSAGGNIWPLTLKSASGSVFSGILKGNIRLNLSSAGQSLSGVENNFGNKQDGNVYVLSGADVGVQSFGSGSSGGSLGANYHSYFKYYCPVLFDGNGKLTYLGYGETSDRWFKFVSPVAAEIDGGANGGLALTGKIFSGVDEQTVMTFSGGAASACTLSSAIVPASAGNSIYLAKSGAGTWTFIGVTNNVNGGVVGVEEGTLRFDKLTDKGRPSSFGLSNRLGTKYLGGWDDAKSADYAVLLGSAGSEGTIEHIGNLWDNAASDRPIAVTGRGGRIKVDGAERRLGVKRVFAADAAGSTLTLDGTAVENVLYDAADVHGRLSIVKEGSGSWTLAGDQTFSGDLKVKAGALTVSSTLGMKYSWYRCTVKGRENVSAADKICLRELCLYRKSSERANLNMTDAGDNTIPLPGQASVWRSSVTYNSTSKCPKQGVEYLFEGKGVYDANQQYFSCMCGGANPDDGNPDHWIPIVMRLVSEADADAEVDAWDAVSSERAAHAYTPSKWTMEASADGLFWDLVTATEDEGGSDVCKPTGSSQWLSDGTAAASGILGTRNGGYRFGLDRGRSLLTKTSDQLSNASVSVAPGAVLKAEGAVTIRKLEVDMSGAGTIDGFAFAADGTLNVTGEAGRGSIELPLTLDAIRGTPDFSGWSVKINGALRLSRSLEYKNGKLKVLVPGMTVIVR